MMSAIILVETPSGAAAATLRDVAKSLSALVPFVVNDLIADAFVVAKSGLDLDAIEQSAGCIAIGDDVRAHALTKAIGLARRDTLLILRAGYAPDATFGDEIVEAGERDGLDRCRSVLAEPTTLLQRLMPNLSHPAMLVAPRARLTHAISQRRDSVAALARALKASPMRSRAYRV